jgi:glycosyltransferase involved in cell wall biosynthesis
MRALREKRPDIILPYTMHPNIACGLVWRNAGAKKLIWNQRDEGILRMPESLERRVVRLCPLFVANSKKGMEFLVEKLKVSPDKVSVIHNGIELDPPELSREGWRKKLDVGDAFLACKVANLSGTKEWKTLFKAWGRFLKEWEQKGQRAFLLLAGDGFENRLKLDSLSRELGIAHAVLFLGRVDDITGLLKAVDLALFSSVSEGLPNGVLEPMASGLAVVATDIPGIREAVGPDGIPFLVPSGDDRAFSEIILKLAHDPELRKRTGEANQRRVADEFKPEKMYTQMTDLLIGKLE